MGKSHTLDQQTVDRLVYMKYKGVYIPTIFVLSLYAALHMTLVDKPTAVFITSSVVLLIYITFDLSKEREKRPPFYIYLPLMSLSIAAVLFILLKSIILNAIIIILALVYFFYRLSKESYLFE